MSNGSRSSTLALAAAGLIGCSPGTNERTSNGITAQSATGGSEGVVITPASGGTSGDFINVGTAGSGGGGGEGADNCGHQEFQVAQKPADVLLVLDRSASMTEDMTPTKWSIVVPALQQVISATDGSINWGLKVFPVGTDPQCTQGTYPAGDVVPIAPHNAGTVNAAIAATPPTGNGTPTGMAINEAVKDLQAVQDANPKFILLATDGEPSCSTMSGSVDSSGARTAAVAAVTAAASAGIHTFVVGIATTKESATTVLNALADAGLEARPRTDPNPLATWYHYYLASTKDELIWSFSTITSVVATCAFTLAKPAPEPDLVNVYVGDRVAANAIPRDQTDTDGWDYVGTDNLTLQLFGSACERVGAQSVQVDYVCPGDTVY
jgi:hypothetical protein